MMYDANKTPSYPIKYNQKYYYYYFPIMAEELDESIMENKDAKAILKPHFEKQLKKKYYGYEDYPLITIPQDSLYLP